MSDTPAPEVANDPEGDLFAPMPTPAWAHLIETRLNELEQAHADGGTALPADVPPAGLTPEQEEQILTALQGIDKALTNLRTDLEDLEKTTAGRLDRHREAIEELKVHQNDLLKLIRTSTASGSPL